MSVRTNYAAFLHYGFSDVIKGGKICIRISTKSIMPPSMSDYLKKDGDISSSAKLESNSISNQKALILDFLKDKKDIEVVSVRVDDGYSGSNFDRPAFQAMLEDIRRWDCRLRSGKDLSRFGREYIDSGKYIERLFPALGVRFIAINDNYDSLKGKNQADEIIIPFKNLINDAYCRDISIKIRE